MPRNKYHDTPVVEFHEACSFPVEWYPTTPPLPVRLLRAKMIFEEFLELLEASGLKAVWQDGEILIHASEVTPSATLAADALGDLRYLIDGGNLEWGFPGEKILREIHRSNMTKLGRDGKPLLRADGKILKGPGYEPPAIKEILMLYARDEGEGK